MLNRFTVATVVALGIAAPSLGTSYTMNFDTDASGAPITAGTALNAQYAAWGVSFNFTTPPPASVSHPSGGNGAWATNVDHTVVSSTGSDVGGLGTGPGAISGNLLRSFNGWLSENGDSYIRISFASLVDSVSADFGGIADVPSTRIFAFNGATLLASAIATSTTGRDHLSISGAGTFDSVIITAGDYNDWVGVDNVTFNTVPAPATGALLGMGAMAAARRRRA